MCVRTHFREHVLRSEDNFAESNLAFRHVGPRDHIQVVSHGWMSLLLPCRPTGPAEINLK